MAAGLMTKLALLPAVLAVLSPTVPKWKPTYNMSMSTLTMQCNSSGWSSPSRGAQFGIVSYDWSNAKAQWAATKPMDCEERLVTQAAMTKAINPASNVFVYRNLVKALPWFKTVRDKLNDPNYSGWFLRFDTSKSRSSYHVPACAPENSSKCSMFYHDQEQTPEVPTSSQPHPDGTCVDYCDCGDAPCGEYLFDHRNSSLQSFIINEVILGPTGLGHPAIDGYFIDDYWCSDLICKSAPETPGCPCGDPVQGPTEVDRNSQVDMGLSDEDIRDLTVAWNDTMALAQEAILNNSAYTWSLMHNQGNANAMPELVTPATCAVMLTEACKADSVYQTQAMLVGVTINGTNMTQLTEDLAFFLLARGDYAWLGWGAWGMTWPFNPEPAHGELPPLPHGVARPAQLDKDYGEPTGLCEETSPGVFVRAWTKADVKLDCHSFKGSIVMKSGSV
eukprot:TRINITY_DN6822_c0_g1_i1.p1 TRINITY_DN6822_c0_g1~~TRINITY_DN6822_c0_g1_i1.p1  ORF type:complete len:447 (+),score=75.41 TRINITY_DN6822_c0_g1_i1:2-1342(+)